MNWLDLILNHQTEDEKSKLADKIYRDKLEADLDYSTKDSSTKTANEMAAMDSKLEQQANYVIQSQPDLYNTEEKRSQLIASIKAGGLAQLQTGANTSRQITDEVNARNKYGGIGKVTSDIDLAKVQTDLTKEQELGLAADNKLATRKAFGNDTETEQARRGYIAALRESGRASTEEDNLDYKARSVDPSILQGEVVKNRFPELLKGGSKQIEITPEGNIVVKPGLNPSFDSMLQGMYSGKLGVGGGSFSAAGAGIRPPSVGSPSTQQDVGRTSAVSIPSFGNTYSQQPATNFVAPQQSVTTNESVQQPTRLPYGTGYTLGQTVVGAGKDLGESVVNDLKLLNDLYQRYVGKPFMQGYNKIGGVYE